MEDRLGERESAKCARVLAILRRIQLVMGGCKEQNTQEGGRAGGKTQQMQSSRTAAGWQETDSYRHPAAQEPSTPTAELKARSGAGSSSAAPLEGAAGGAGAALRQLHAGRSDRPMAATPRQQARQPLISQLLV